MIKNEKGIFSNFTENVSSLEFLLKVSEIAPDHL